MSEIAVVGAGAVGTRVARQLVAASIAERVAVHDRNLRRAHDAVDSIGAPAGMLARDGEPTDASIVILACPVADHVELARRALDRGASVITVTDSVIEVQMLLSLDPLAHRAGCSLVIGAGMSPGLTCVLARFAAQRFERVDEIHVAKVGTGGPSCARQHHRALAGWAIDRRDGDWVRRAGGSGRELLWFPEPVMARDCYRAALPEAFLLAPIFPDCSRITARVAATRRDRVTAGLPMLIPPHTEGGIGAVRVELRGRRSQGVAVDVVGAADRPAVAAAAVAATAAAWIVSGRVEPGAGGLARLDEPGLFLREVRERGVRLWSFDGHAESQAR